MTTTSLPTIPVWTMCDRLVKSRKAAGLSQTELAELLGIGRRSITRYEDGHTEPSTAVLVAWAYFTNVQTAWLLDGTTDSVGGESTPSTCTPLTAGQDAYALPDAA
jgi:transcriptional regulator with XRE-family HTH domain